LDVVGVGPSLDRLRAIAGPTVEFHGRIDDQAVVQLLEGCRALCVAATEDFGIVPVEANAAGKPVVAFAAGGVLETITDGVNGALFNTLSEQALLAAIVRADTIDTSPEDLARMARRFSGRRFRRQIQALVDDALAERG
jgi:glycosyltransferase involved in cell wall biosynthesis